MLIITRQINPKILDELRKTSEECGSAILVLQIT